MQAPWVALTSPSTRKGREMKEMSQQAQMTSRDAVLVEDAALIRMMGLPVLEAVPSPRHPMG
jgi:hypothetical protein